MSRYKPYPQYKDSGIEWLGQVPEHWTTIRLKYIMVEKRKKIAPSLPCGAISFGNVVYKEAESIPVATRETYQEVLCGEFLINPINLNYDLKSLRTALSEIDVCVSPAYIVLDSGYEFEKSFLKYLLFCFDILHMKTLGAGVRQTITFNDIGNCYVCIPFLAEQCNIAKILDRETTRIDALIEKKSRFIELLQEKRQALITQAVTKGLDPKVKLKNSGVKWLGLVPEHWEVKRLKFIASIQTGVAKGKDNSERKVIEVPYLRVANVQDGFLDLSEVTTIEIPEEELERYLLQPGDVLMNEGGDYDKLGRGHVWSGEIAPCIHQNHVFAVRPHAVLPDWLNRFTSSTGAQFYFIIHSKQSTNLASISSSNLKELSVTAPPEKEQKTILKQLEIRLSRIDALITATQRSMELLKERRAAIITAAVTGQIDLRDSATGEGEIL